MQASLRLIFPKDRRHELQTSLQQFLSAMGGIPCTLKEEDYWKLESHIQLTAALQSTSHSVEQIKVALLSAFSLPREDLTEYRDNSSVEIAKYSHPNATAYPDCLFLVLNLPR